jgi:hypothetical protein
MGTAELTNRRLQHANGAAGAKFDVPDNKGSEEGRGDRRSISKRIEYRKGIAAFMIIKVH